MIPLNLIYVSVIMILTFAMCYLYYLYNNLNDRIIQKNISLSKVLKSMHENIICYKESTNMEIKYIKNDQNRIHKKLFSKRSIPKYNTNDFSLIHCELPNECLTFIANCSFDSLRSFYLHETMENMNRGRTKKNLSLYTLNSPEVLNNCCSEIMKKIGLEKHAFWLMFLEELITFQFTRMPKLKVQKSDEYFSHYVKLVEFLETNGITISQAHFIKSYMYWYFHIENHRKLINEVYDRRNPQINPKQYELEYSDIKDYKNYYDKINSYYHDKIQVQY